MNKYVTSCNYQTKGINQVKEEEEEEEEESMFIDSGMHYFEK